MQLITELKKIIAEFDLLKHVFYQAWSRGELNQAILKKYATQYYQQVSSFPRFISRVHTHCPKIEVRQELVKNLYDEELKGTNHPELWMQFGDGLGATRSEMMNDEPLSETQAMVDTYYQLANDWQEGLCALYAYEYQVPEVSASKIEGLKKFYGIDDEKTLEFFTAHQVYDVEHADTVAQLIETHVDPLKAKKATRQAAMSLYTFLDGMCRVNGINNDCQLM